MLVYGTYILRGAKSGCKMVMLFDSYSYDGVSAGIWVLHIEGCQIWVQDGHAFCSVPNDCLWYDKLWGPSQRVVTLFIDPFFLKKESWVHGKTGACGFAGPNTDLGFFPLPLFTKYEECKL